MLDNLITFQKYDNVSFNFNNNLRIKDSLSFLNCSNFNIKIGLNWYLINPRDLGVKELLLNDGEKRTYLKDSMQRCIYLIQKQ